MVDLRTLAVGVALAALLGCGDGDGNYLLTCDIGKPGCQNSIFASVAASVGYAGPVPNVRTISVDQLEAELREGLTDDMTDGSDPVSRGLKLFGIIPTTMQSTAEARIQLLLTWLGAYYSSASKSITVIDRGYADVSGQNLLAHEFMHAIQDGQFGLGSLGASSTDESLAVRSVIEGDATHLADRWTLERLNDVPDVPPLSIERELIDLYTMREDNLLSDVGDMTTAIIALEQNFPYAFGYEFMTELYGQTGLGGRGDAFAMPPVTALSILFGASIWQQGNVPATTHVDSAHPAPLTGYEAVVEDTLGAWYLYAYLVRSGLDDTQAWDDALRWRGDRFAIYDNGSDITVVWKLLIDDTLASVIGRIDAALQGYGQNFEWGVAVDEDTLYVVAAEDTNQTAAWLSAATGQ